MKMKRDCLTPSLECPSLDNTTFPTTEVGKCFLVFTNILFLLFKDYGPRAAGSGGTGMTWLDKMKMNCLYWRVLMLMKFCYLAKTRQIIVRILQPAKIYANQTKLINSIPTV